MAVRDQRAACLERCLDPSLRLVVGDGDVEMDPVALGTGLVHLLKPDRQALTEGVDQALRVAGVLPVSHHRPPERAHPGDVDGVDRDLHHLHRSNSLQAGLQSPTEPRHQVRDPARRLHLGGGHPPPVRRTQAQKGCARPEVDEQAVAGIPRESHRQLGGLGERGHGDGSAQRAQHVAPPETADRVRQLPAAQAHSRIVADRRSELGRDRWTAGIDDVEVVPHARRHVTGDEATDQEPAG